MLAGQVEVSFDLSGFTDYELALARMIALLTDLRSFWPVIVPLWAEWMREQFKTEGEWGGDPWAPLSEAYLARKMKLYPGKGILYATGDLRRAASQPQRIATPESITFVVDDSQKRHGGKEPRSVIDYHQQGTATMPARPVVPEFLPLRAQEQVELAAQEWVDSMCQTLGLV